MCLRQLVDEVIERGAEVVQAVTEDEAELSGRLPEVCDPHKVLAALNVELGENSVRAYLCPTVNFVFQALQVVERSADPESMSG